MMENVGILLNRIKSLRHKLNTEKLSQDEKMMIIDDIKELNRKIELLSKKDHISIQSASPKIKERKYVRPSRMGENNFLL